MGICGRIYLIGFDVTTFVCIIYLDVYKLKKKLSHVSRQTAVAESLEESRCLLGLGLLCLIVLSILLVICFSFSVSK